MKTTILFFSLCFAALVGSAQVAPNKYWVQFTDKDDSPYSIQQPEEFLSQRAIDRRNAQGIAVDLSDLPVNPAYIDSVLNLGGIELLNRSKWFNAITIYTEDTTKINQILSFPFVGFVKSNRRVVLEENKDQYLESESFSPLETGFQEKGTNNYGASFNQISMLNGHMLHDLGYRGEGMVIAVIDAGYINTNQLPIFDSLIDAGRLLGTWDFVSNHESVFEDHTHGTHVLSTMAGMLTDTLVGTAPKASYWLLRSEDAATEYIIEEDNWVAAAEFADSVGANLLNTSLGYTTFDDTSQSHTYEDLDGNTTRIAIGADMAASKGMLVINSAGNYGDGPWTHIGTPADGDSVLAVGAVNADEEYASFSSIGPSADGQVKPNVMAQGQGAVVASIGGGVINANGTSFSSPILAGLAACLWQMHPLATNMEIFQAIEMSAHLFNNPNDSMGYGIPDFYVAHLLLSTTSLDLQEEQGIVKVYPNPFRDNVNVLLYSEKDQQITIEILDMMGRKVSEEAIEAVENTLCLVNCEGEMQALSNGTYLLRMITSDKIYVSKLQKR